jgi:hypothetical protein
VSEHSFPHESREIALNSGQLSAEASVGSGCQFPTRSEIRTAGLDNQPCWYPYRQGWPTTLDDDTRLCWRNGAPCSGPLWPNWSYQR